jgi:hypothetical protein
LSCTDCGSAGTGRERVREGKREGR